MFRTVILLALSVAAIPAQTTGALNGIVVDPAGSLIPGVRLQVRETTSAATRDTTSSVRGFELKELAPGTYDVILWPTRGFVARKIEGVTIRAGEVRDLGKLELDLDPDLQPMVGQMSGTLTQRSVSVWEIALCTRFPNNPVLVFEGSSVHLRFPSK